MRTFSAGIRKRGAAHANDLVVARLEKDHRPARLVQGFVHQPRHLPVQGIGDDPLHTEFLTLLRNPVGFFGPFFEPALEEHFVEASTGRNGLVKQRRIVGVEGDPQHATIDVGFLHVEDFVRG